MEAELVGLSNVVDFSLGALFLRASMTVKIVMGILIFGSVWSWAIAIQKLIRFRIVRFQFRKFEKIFWSGKPLDELYDLLVKQSKGPMNKVFLSGMEEWERSHRDNGEIIPGSTFRIERMMDLNISKEHQKLVHSLGFLATVASAAPFIGLFGTVWGIKNTFEAIANTQNTNLAVVAPGVAEALVATALGLFAAIPAVIFYNKLSTDLDRIVKELETFSDEFTTMFSRQSED
ncbi:MAG: protein TolQ [Paracoccaceae bacterium]